MFLLVCVSEQRAAGSARCGVPYSCGPHATSDPRLTGEQQIRSPALRDSRAGDGQCGDCALQARDRPWHAPARSWLLVSTGVCATMLLSMDRRPEAPLALSSTARESWAPGRTTAARYGQIRTTTFDRRSDAQGGKRGGGGSLLSCSLGAPAHPNTIRLWWRGWLVAVRATRRCPCSLRGSACAWTTRTDPVLPWVAPPGGCQYSASPARTPGRRRDRVPGAAGRGCRRASVGQQLPPTLLAWQATPRLQRGLGSDLEARDQG